ncbi:hypothetical protein VNO77_05909 [Canavalia gladiata]|uniref:Uncharacterized protein n=1 Tax=Canavalia gladiata TaxID=3824 RepID=A0AAN9RAF5_CANGL
MLPMINLLVYHNSTPFERRFKRRFMQWIREVAEFGKKMTKRRRLYTSIHFTVKTIMILQSSSSGEEKNFERGERGSAFKGYFLPMSLIN